MIVSLGNEKNSSAVSSQFFKLCEIRQNKLKEICKEFMQERKGFLSQHINKEKKQEQNIEFCGGNYALIPLLLVIFLVPLIMRVYLYDSGLTGFTWYPDRTPETDVFLYWKGILLAALAAIMRSEERRVGKECL